MSYRDVTESLRVYRDQIARELEEARRSASKLKGLQRELAETETLLRAAGAKRPLPLLDSLQIASPCKASWDAMVGDERVRFCGECKKNVYNVSAMPREEAEALLREREGRLCVRLYRRTDGTVLTADCPVGVRRKRRRHAAIAAVAAVGCGAMAAMGLDGPGMRATMGVLSPRITPRETAVERMGELAPVIGDVGEPPPEPVATATPLNGRTIRTPLPKAAPQKAR
jgi:hypothetical protein